MWFLNCLYSDSFRNQYNLKMHDFLTIQKKPNRHFKMNNSFVDAIELEKFAGSIFKRWSTKLDLWLTVMDKSWVVN